MRVQDLPFLGHTLHGQELRQLTAEAISSMESFTIKTGRPQIDVAKFVAFCDAAKAAALASELRTKHGQPSAPAGSPMLVDTTVYTRDSLELLDLAALRGICTARGLPYTTNKEPSLITKILEYEASLLVE